MKHIINKNYKQSLLDLNIILRAPSHKATRNATYCGATLL